MCLLALDNFHSKCMKRSVSGSPGPLLFAASRWVAEIHCVHVEQFRRAGRSEHARCRYCTRKCKVQAGPPLCCLQVYFTFKCLEGGRGRKQESCRTRSAARRNEGAKDWRRKPSEFLDLSHRSVPVSSEVKRGPDVLNGDFQLSAD